MQRKGEKKETSEEGRRKGWEKKNKWRKGTEERSKGRTGPSNRRKVRRREKIKKRQIGKTDRSKQNRKE